MAYDRALYWIAAQILIAIGFICGPIPALAVAASVGFYIACDQIAFGGKVTRL
jgi:hypothetical protein